jgi:nitrogen-specific signal transduction histidine kinase
MPSLAVDKSRLLRILVILFNNAAHAMKNTAADWDAGEGITASRLARVSEMGGGATFTLRLPARREEHLH